MSNVDTGSDYFTADAYPEVMKEIRVMVHNVSKIDGTFKQEILLSYLRDHSVKVSWLVDNDPLVNMVTTGSLRSFHTEKLFETKRSNKSFLADLEGYIATELANCPSNAKHRNVLSVLSSSALLPNLRYYACSADAA